MRKTGPILNRLVQAKYFFGDQSRGIKEISTRIWDIPYLNHKESRQFKNFIWALSLTKDIDLFNSFLINMCINDMWDNTFYNIALRNQLPFAILVVLFSYWNHKTIPQLREVRKFDLVFNSGLSQERIDEIEFENTVVTAFLWFGFVYFFLVEMLIEPLNMT